MWIKNGLKINNFNRICYDARIVERQSRNYSKAREGRAKDESRSRWLARWVPNDLARIQDTNNRYIRASL